MFEREHYAVYLAMMHKARYPRCDALITHGERCYTDRYQRYLAYNIEHSVARTRAAHGLINLNLYLMFQLHWEGLDRNSVSHESETSTVSP